VTPPGSPALDPSVRAALVEVVGEAHVLTDPDVTASYGQDWSRRFRGPVLAVVRPGSTGEVAAVMSACARAGVPVLPQGGNTGLVGGSVPAADGPAMVVLSTVRLTRLDPVDGAMGQVTAGAGVTIAALHEHARAAGWTYGVDLASRESCTVGGTIATNAGGIRVCCYGMTRSQVLGLEAVLADGSVVEHLGGLVKDNTGYDLTGLLVGSEGTLGIVTAARLALHRPPRASAVALVGARDASHALDIVESAVPQGVRLLAAELVDVQILRKVCDHTGLPWPLAGGADSIGALLVLETESRAPGEVALDLADDLEAVVAVDAADRARLWRYREAASEAVTATAVAHRFDVTVPRRDWDTFLDDVRARLVDVPDVRDVLAFGHLWDGNLHLEVLGPEPDDERADEAVLRTVAAHGGSISAEHGVGRAKAAYLHLSRSPAELAAMRALKDALDPQHLLNPGAVLPR